jgi:hypothetical protein
MKPRPETARELAAASPWRPPTRRAFVAMLGAAALAVRARQGLLGGGDTDDRPPQTWTGTTRWIGHC